jgi:hypothetical protein
VSQEFGSLLNRARRTEVFESSISSFVSRNSFLNATKSNGSIRALRDREDRAMKWTSWTFLAFVGSLMFLVLFIKDREIKSGIDRLYKMNQSDLEADPNPKLISERSPYMRTERY